MKKVHAFQTEDGKVHTDEGAAILHERLIEFRGLIQSKSTTMATQENASGIAKFIAENGDEINEINQKFKRRITGYTNRMNKNAISMA